MLLSKVFPPPKKKRGGFLPFGKILKKIGGKKRRKNHTTAAAQARQEGLVHSVTHRGKGIEVTKIRRARRTSWT